MGTGPETKFTDRFIDTPESDVGSGFGTADLAAAFLAAGRKIGCFALLAAIVCSMLLPAAVVKLHCLLQLVEALVLDLFWGRFGHFEFK